MYAYIRGKLAHKDIDFVVVEAAGLGYEIWVSYETLSSLPPVGSEVKLYLYQVVKEDELALYGFGSAQEKQMFIKLISISGIGPKVALSILSGMNVSLLSTAILTGDVKLLAKVKGIGKKTAERIILELKESVGEDAVLLSAASVGVSSGSAVDTVCADALEALESMGLSRSDAYDKVLKARESTDNVAEIVRAVLKGWHTR
ncbi:MAG: Holliday junction branch migration protein RuvA [Clostridia bacterium]|nr:Holliday junction branch migration protein RuvA [Clostridia bacterium]